MTINAPENNTEAAIPQDKVDTNQPQQQVESQPNQTKAVEDAKEDPNWRAFREARKKDRADKEAAERRAAEKEAEAAALKAAMEAAFARSSMQQSGNSGQFEGYQQEESEDERIEKKVQAAIAQREAAAERARQEREMQEYPQRLRQMFPDFDQVMQQENLDYLEYHYGEVAKPLSRLPEGFDKWADIYRNVKKFVPNNTSAKREAVKADMNALKPKSMSGPNMSQPADVGGSARLTEEKRAANWERMQKMLRSVG